MNNPYVELAATLVLLIVVLIGGKFYLEKNPRKSVPVAPESGQEVVPPKVDMSKFEVAVKRTEIEG